MRTARRPTTQRQAADSGTKIHTVRVSSLPGEEEPEAAPDETESAQPAGEEVTSDIPETVPDDLADLSSLTDGMDDTDKTPMEASDNTESVESTENAAENGDAGGLDDDLDALLA